LNHYFIFSYLSTEWTGILLSCFLNGFGDSLKRHVIVMKKKTQMLALEDDFLVDLTFHSVPASLLSEFEEEIVRPYYKGNINAAIQDLLHKVLREQDFIQSHITHIRSGDV
jgi:hypothetical protein